MVIESTSLRRVEVYSFHPAVWVLVPLSALVLEVSLPVYIRFSSILDFPLLVVIYFALARRSPVPGLLAGAIVGAAQDSLSRDPIGLYAISNTLIGYITSMVTSKMEAEAIGIRFILIAVLFGLHQLCVYALGVALLGESGDFTFFSVIGGAVMNALCGVLFFALLDHFRRPA